MINMKVCVLAIFHCLERPALLLFMQMMLLNFDGEECSATCEHQSCL